MRKALSVSEKILYKDDTVHLKKRKETQEEIFVFYLPFFFQQPATLLNVFTFLFYIECEFFLRYLRAQNPPLHPWKHNSI